MMLDMELKILFGKSRSMDMLTKKIKCVMP